MATIPNRYAQLTGLMPKGQFWDALGAVIPKRSTPYQFLFETGIPNRRFGVFDNDAYQYVVVTDALGQATVALDLGIGEHTIRIEDDVTGNQFKAYATVRAYATWHAAYAEVLESLDLDIEQIYEGSHLEQSISMYLNEFWGREVGQTNNLLYATETFRGVLWNLRQAYRWSGATKHGLQQAVWAFTSSSPWIVPRPWRARWILDTPLLPNFDLQTYARTLDYSAGDPLEVINAQRRVFVHRDYDGSLASPFPGPFFNPPTAQTLIVLFRAGWTGGDIVVDGTTTTGDIISETFTSPPLPIVADTLVAGTQTFTTVTGAAKSLVGAAFSAAIGLSTSQFLTMNSLNSLVPLGNEDIKYSNGGPTVGGPHAGNDPAAAFPIVAAIPPDAPAVLHIGFDTLWDGGDVVVSGLDSTGIAIVETFPACPGALVLGTLAFSLITSITKTIVGVDPATAFVGVAEDMTIYWSGAPIQTPIPTSGTYTLPFPSAEQVAFLALNISPYNFDNGHLAADEEAWTNRIFININGRGWVEDVVGGPGIGLPMPLVPDPAAIVAASINTAITADPRYGAVYATASAVTGASLADIVVKIENPAVIGEAGSVEIGSGPSDAAFPLFGFPESLTKIVAPAPAAGNLVPVVGTSLANFPLVDDRTGVSGVATGIVSGPTGTACTFSANPATSFVPLDVGRYVRIDNTAVSLANIGTHQITTVAADGLSCTIENERGSAFVAESNVDWRVKYYNLSIAGRVGRGIRIWTGAADLTITTLDVPPTTCVVQDPTSPFRPSDVGGWIRMRDGIVTPLGMGGSHQVIEYIAPDEVRILHVDAGTGGVFTTPAIFPIEYSLWTQGEVVDVVDVDRVANTATIRTLVENWPAGDTYVESGDSPDRRVDETSLVSSTVTVDRTAGLCSPVGSTATLTVEGSSIPDGWSPLLGIDLTNTRPGYLAKIGPTSLVLYGTGVAFMVLGTPICPNVELLKGRTVRWSIWVQQHMSTSASFELFAVSGGVAIASVFSSAVSGTVVELPHATRAQMPLEPILLTGTHEIPYDVTDYQAQIHIKPIAPAVGDEIVSIHRVFLTVEDSTGVFMGSGTVPRSALETAFGEVLYAWSPQELTVAENNAIGLPSGVAGDPINIANNTQDHIDQIVEAHGYWQRFDPTTYDGAGAAENLKGAYKDTEWTNATMFNMELVTESPSRLSYLQPIRVSAVTGEALAVTGPGPGTAALANRSTHRGNPEGSWASPEQLPNTGSALGPAGQTLEYPTRLYKDGVPLEDTAAPGAYVWRFSDASNIGIFNPPLLPVSDAWTIDYQVEMSVYTDVIDLGANFADYVWLVDAAIWLRRETLETPRQVTQEVQFLGDNTAALSIRSDQDKLTGVLTADNGSVLSQVDESNWSYVSSNQISIEPAAFSADSIYSFTYTGVTGDPTPQAEIVLEWRSNATNNPGDFSVLGAVPVPAWTVVEEGFVVDRTMQYHQFRLTVYDVNDLRDIRVYGLGLRGVNLYGTPPSAPGILLP